MVSLSDLLNGPKLFEDNFGARWGPRLWRGFFILALGAIVIVCLTTIGGFGRAIYSEVAGWLPGITAPPPPPPPLPLPRQAAPPARNYTTKTVDELWTSMCENRTALQCDLFLADEKGKWINLEGVVMDIAPHNFVVFRAGGENKRWANCSFSEIWTAKLGALYPSEIIKITGKIIEFHGDVLDLGDCDLISP